MFSTMGISKSALHVNSFRVFFSCLALGGGDSGGCGGGWWYCLISMGGGGMA